MPGTYETADGKIDNKKKQELLSKRYVPEPKKAPVNENKLWEDAQASRAVQQYGSKDKVFNFSLFFLF